MSTCRYHKVMVVRDETTRVQKDVWEWEFPILEASHPPGFVILEATPPGEDERAKPDAAEEYERLDRVYGNQEDTSRPLVELVYGFQAKGVADLRKRINNAFKKGAKAPWESDKDEDSGDK